MWPVIALVKDACSETVATKEPSTLDCSGQPSAMQDSRMSDESKRVWCRGATREGNYPGLPQTAQVPLLCKPVISGRERSARDREVHHAEEPCSRSTTTDRRWVLPVSKDFATRAANWISQRSLRQALRSQNLSQFLPSFHLIPIHAEEP